MNLTQVAIWTSVGSLFATVVLVAITGFYAWQTWQLVKKDTYPDVRCWFQLLQSNSTAHCLVIENLGSSPAFDVEFTVVVEGESSHSPSESGLDKYLPRYAVIHAGERKARIVTESFEEFTKSYGKKSLLVNVEYRRKPGDQIPVSSTFRLSTDVKSLGGELLLPPGDLRETHAMVRDIRDSLKSTTKAIDGLADAVHSSAIMGASSSTSKGGE